ncbi:MAG: CpXC domain-containing protein [Paracoccaceae bacterium]
MSLFMPVDLACPFCNETVTMDAVGSVNADRRPDFRDAILDNQFQDATCGACGKSFRLQPEFAYLDVGRRQWIAAMPADRMPYYLKAEDEARQLFEQSYGAKAPAAAQAVGNDLDVRITFGWPGLREKLYARANDLDDAVLEMLKLDLLRELPSAPLSPGIELRLIKLIDDQMAFAWVDAFSEEPVEQLAVRRGWYDQIAAEAGPWQPTRDKLENGPFVDMQKLYMGQGRAAAG